MRCKDCGNFQRGNMEAGKELAPPSKQVTGRCNIDSKNYDPNDSCSCGGFRPK